MKGPLQRFRRRSSGPAPESEPAQGPSPTPGDATQAMPVVAAQEGLPAGQAPDDGAPSFRHRGRLRRRLRYLRRVRELGFRDLGGLVFDQHRFDRSNEDLLRAKVEALAAVDRELRTLEHVLADRRPATELREPGITVCARCGALPGSDAHFCPSCGTPQRGARTIAGVGDGSPAPQALAPTAQPMAAAPQQQPPAPQQATAVSEPPSTPAPGRSEAPTTSHEATPRAREHRD